MLDRVILEVYLLRYTDIVAVTASQVHRGTLISIVALRFPFNLTGASVASIQTGSNLCRLLNEQTVSTNYRALSEW